MRERSAFLGFFFQTFFCHHLKGNRLEELVSSITTNGKWTRRVTGKKALMLNFPVCHLKAGVCNHAALPGQEHIIKLVHGPQLHVSSSAGLTTY